MVIKINYTSSDVYVSTSVSPVYVVVNYSAVNNAGGVAWGAITGTLSDQTDLQTALDAKFDDPTGTTAQYLRGDGSIATFPAIPGGTVTSVGLTMPSAFSVANSPVTSSGTLAVTGAGTADQYVRGDGQLANFPTNQGGGSSVNYYLNGSVNQGTFGGDTYYEMSKTPIIGSGTNFTRTNAQGNGYIASFITDAGDPALLNIPGGNWNLEFYFAASSSGSTPSFYAELYKVSSSNVFTLISSGSTNPEGITNGTVIDQYFTSIPVPQTSLLATDRLAIRIFVTPSGRTITLHTEDNNLCEVLTTFSTGLNALNGLTSQVQYFATGTSGTDFAISSATDTHTFNLPTASASNRGALSSADWTTFSGKVGGTGTTGQVAYWNGAGSVTGSSNLTYSGGYLTNTNTATDSAILIIRPNQTTYQSFIGVGTVGAYSPTNLFWSFGLVPGNQDFNIQSFNGTTVSSRIKIFASTGNISLNAGANSDGGQRLQVYGDAFVRGSGATSATSALLVQNSAGTSILNVRNDQYLIVNGQFLLQGRMDIDDGFRSIFAGNTRTSVGRTSTGTSTIFYSGLQITSGNAAWSFNADNAYTLTTGNINGLFVRNNFAPTSGTATFSNEISTTINQTGGANGITRGLYVNPTLTAAADWRSIEWSNNSGWGLYGAGTALNYLGGRLGIGSTSVNAAWMLGVSGNLQISGFLSFGATNIGSSNAYIEVGASEVSIFAGTGRKMSFWTDGTVKATLTAAGRLLLGTTTEGFYSLDVVSGLLAARFAITTNSGNNPNAIIETTNGDSARLQIKNSEGSFSLQTNDNIHNITNSNTAISFQDTIPGVRIANGSGGVGADGNMLFVSGTKNAFNTNSRGIFINTTLVAVANGNTLVGLEVNATYTNGAFTGVKNYAIKTTGNINMSSLPTSSAGLSSGDLWNDGGTLKIV